MAVSCRRAGPALGVSNRVIAHYGADDAKPPGAMLVDLARALTVSIDELRSVTPVREKDAAQDRAVPQAVRTSLFPIATR